MKAHVRQAITRRQQAVRLAAQGLEPKAIASQMRVNLETVQGYLSLERNRRESHMSNTEQFRRYINDATAAIEEAKTLGMTLRLGVVTHAGLNAAAEGLRVARHGEALVKRARGAGLNGDGK